MEKVIQGLRLPYIEFMNVAGTPPSLQGTHSVYGDHYSGGQALDATKTMQQLKISSLEYRCH